MSIFIGVPLLAVLAILQSSLMSYLTLLEGRVDLVLLAVVSWGLVGRSEEAMLWGMIGGFFLDMLSSLPLGTSAFTLILVAFLVSLLEGRFWEAHLLMPLGVMLLASLFYHLMGVLIVLIAGHTLSLPLALSRVILPSTFLNVALALPASQMAEGLRNRLYPPEVEI